jgi:dethiobiotin synthetase
MQFFLAGTDTNIGKTIVSSWISLHTLYPYWKPIQSGTEEGTDSATVQSLSSSPVYPETYTFQAPLSPHLAARLEGKTISLSDIRPPSSPNLIIEGAGGLLVPLTPEKLIIDLIQSLKLPVLLVARSTLGTINHTCLSLEALRHRNIPILGVILNGPLNPENRKAVEFYGRTEVLAELPFLPEISYDSLKSIPFPTKLATLLEK